MSHGISALRAIRILVPALAATFFVAQASLAETERRSEFEGTCSERCLGKDKAEAYCGGYCGCMSREIFLGRSNSQLDRLHEAMQPQAPESEAKEILKLLVRQCTEEAKKEFGAAATVSNDAATQDTPPAATANETVSSPPQATPAQPARKPAPAKPADDGPISFGDGTKVY